MVKRKKYNLKNLGDYAVPKNKRQKKTNDCSISNIDNTSTVVEMGNVPIELPNSRLGASNTPFPEILPATANGSQCTPETMPVEHEGNIIPLCLAGNEQRGHEEALQEGEYERGRNNVPLEKSPSKFVNEIGKSGENNGGSTEGENSIISKWIDSSNPAGTYVFPPTAEEAHTAYLNIGGILKPRNTNGKGFRSNPKLNRITQERFEQMRHFCYTYWKMQKDSSTRSKWTAASKESATYFGRGVYLAQNLREWVRKFIEDRGYVPEHFQQRKIGRAITTGVR